jgi:hypothetical protein
MPPKAKGKKGKKGDDEDFWYVLVSELTSVYLGGGEVFLGND